MNKEAGARWREKRERAKGYAHRFKSTSGPNHVGLRVTWCNVWLNAPSPKGLPECPECIAETEQRAMGKL